ncbi:MULTISPECIES: 2Fe-2S iron-sulfur cluster-binding protein [Vibrio]|uniref:2Fe-2S iron-sulfur cluster-binding protein n=1 Tax=Vibrio TaxID=662 RepID=UPI001CDC4C72|nr:MULTISPECIES: 2Fe-2S iron-sulfur cluster-binding protein [Vibrio]ELA6610812.1 2Fe-2S iron-sulfur cluster binding domain-containing protein [Vibrio alginolyticus]MCA2485838.1 2Fe-2S iron-sulfur cluster binding domain-containing protein [Vibrio alginolyticus]MCS0172611.1 2Fe-2S iron-sulfur cluster-binding protein [Vibrio alginolyticus]MCS0234737.1 2Fe-2S iron-sulfur cluster-binding protein [Vibrio alginolyticus]MCS0274250.1 2Fe-2S iron-sulfur cluster-binding protein [Vibrio alginolyticus]
MSHQVHLLPMDVTFQVKEGETVLEAALNNNIRFPHRCQVGACAMCMCKKLTGEVSYHLEPMLTEKEQQQGWILPCQAYTESNLVLTFDE